MASRGQGPVPLRVGRTVILDASGAGEITLAPEDIKGPPTWRIAGVIAKTDRPGQAPIPRCDFYLDTRDAQGTIGATYDGSYASGRADITMTKGQQFIAVWSGGQSGDVASLTLSGERL